MNLRNPHAKNTLRALYLSVRFPHPRTFTYNSYVTDSLLQIKLYIPPANTSLVPRPSLIDKLNAGLDSKLTLVSAPAGFGKSTLLSTWVRQAEPDTKAAWLSLDDGDNDLKRFFAYLVAALQTIDNNTGQGLMAALQTPESINIEVALTTLLNEIIEYPGKLVLILDDYHVIESQPIDKAITFLLEHLPAQMHLVIASRIDPSLPLSRLRAGGDMAEIRAHDLRFTFAETAVFLNQVVKIKLSKKDVIALENRTEGWIAGLQLAALSIQGFEQGSDVADFIYRFAGSDRYIQDYLTDEVLEQRPQGTKIFLLETSILNRLCGELCDAVRFGNLGGPDHSQGTRLTEPKTSQVILENLDAANLFIIPLDNERGWYRYHHLFADLLKHRLSQAFPDRIPDLHRRASSWYEQEGLIDDALYHAQAARDKARIVEIIEEHWQDIVHRGELVKLKRWLDSLGPGYTKKSAPLSMAYCWIHVFTGANELIHDHIKDIRELLKVGDGIGDTPQPMKLAVIPSLVETMEATIALEHKQARKAREHAQKAISLIPDTPNPAVRGLLQGAANYRLALAHRELGEYEQASAIFLEGLKMLKASENYFGVAATLLPIVTIYQESGKIKEAINLCTNTLDFFVEVHHLHNTVPTGLVKVMLANLQVDLGDFEAARKNLELGRELVAQISSPQIHNLLIVAEEKLNKVVRPFQLLVEPLSPRELEVLQLIATGYSNREISEKLFLALDTIKGHNRNIYSKLNVKNRTQAINKAISLKILPLQ